eukprot:1703391-Pyramimonas_sp.AAC.1
MTLKSSGAPSEAQRVRTCRKRRSTTISPPFRLPPTFGHPRPDLPASTHAHADTRGVRSRD